MGNLAGDFNLFLSGGKSGKMWVPFWVSMVEMRGHSEAVFRLTKNLKRQFLELLPVPKKSDFIYFGSFDVL